MFGGVPARAAAMPMAAASRPHVPLGFNFFSRLHAERESAHHSQRPSLPACRRPSPLKRPLRTLPLVRLSALAQGLGCARDRERGASFSWAKSKTCGQDVSGAVRV